ncbi:copper resistance D [Anopheles sinensis]|uniref:Copper resistance D n=1 Tax=Anopheles sinensis TaxID=74873 RepID=A0A084VT54_ANOSI|nr:copper resistance D [Anopheles sinensis]
MLTKPNHKLRALCCSTPTDGTDHQRRTDGWMDGDVCVISGPGQLAVLGLTFGNGMDWKFMFTNWTVPKGAKWSDDWLLFVSLAIRFGMQIFPATTARRKGPSRWTTV